MSVSPAEGIDLLVVGHVTEDVLDGRVVLGGAATYAALAARNLGARVAVLTSAGWEPGLVDVLTDIRVARLAAEQTTRFVNRYRDGRREQRIAALAEPLSAQHVPPEWRGAAMVLVAPVAQEVDPALVEAFPEALVAVSPQGWMRHWDRRGRIKPIPWPHAEQVLARAGATILSEEDLPDPRLAERYAAQARLLVVTQAERGARVYHEGQVYQSPAFQPERVADPTGAGDVFAAAFLLALRRTGDPCHSADYANCVASFVVEQPGPAGIPTAEQVEARWRVGRRLAP